jgi:DNA-binding IclR family transcriptional regulator
MNMFSGFDSISSSEIRKKSGQSKPSVARLLGKMCNEGLLQVVGAGRTTNIKNRFIPREPISETIRLIPAL